MEIVIASNNINKVKEYREILEPLNIKCLSLADLNINTDFNEVGNTFKENSLIKAKEVAKYTNKIILADDSGLIIDSLPDILGVHSSRFMEDKPYFEKHKEIIRLLKDKDNRNAHFTTVITLYNYKDIPIYFEGRLDGSIAKIAQGDKGFGYDPIFIPKGYDKTMGVYGLDLKNKISHRAKASQLLLEYLKKEMGKI